MKKIITMICATALLASMSACEKTESATETVSTFAATVTEAVPETTVQEASSTEATEENTHQTVELSFGEPAAVTFQDETGAIYAMGLAAVTNEGTEPVQLPLATMEFTDGAGSVVATAEAVFAFPSVIAPGETAYYYEQVSPEMGATGELTLTLTTDEGRTAELVRYDILTDKIMLRNSPYGGLSMMGQVRNATDNECTLACIAAILYDAEGTPLTVLYTYLMDPLPGQTTLDFTIESFTLPEELTTEAVAAYEVFAYPIG